MELPVMQSCFAGGSPSFADGALSTGLCTDMFAEV